MTAALALGQAMGLPGWLLADVLPEIEHVMLKQLSGTPEAGSEE